MTSTSPRSKTSLKVQINALRRRLRRLDEEERRVAINLLLCDWGALLPYGPVRDERSLALKQERVRQIQAAMP